MSYKGLPFSKSRIKHRPWDIPVSFGKGLPYGDYVYGHFEIPEQAAQAHRFLALGHRIVLNDEQIHIAVEPGSPSRPRSEQDHFDGIRRGDDAANHFQDIFFSHLSDRNSGLVTHFQFTPTTAKGNTSM